MLLGIEYGGLGAALERLSPEMRAVVEATVLDGLTSKEAGRLLGIPQNTVKTGCTGPRPSCARTWQEASHEYRHRPATGTRTTTCSRRTSRAGPARP